MLFFCGILAPNMPVIRKRDAEPYKATGIKNALHYAFPDVERGYSVYFFRLTKHHEQQTLGGRPRIYYITGGAGVFNIKGKKMRVKKDDVVAIPPRTTYDYWPTSRALSCIIFMEAAK